LGDFPKISPRILGVVVILAAILVIFWPALHGDWLWDDDVDITDNPVTHSATGLWSIWFVPGSQIDYYPIKASVQWLQWHLWGMDTLGYHLTNVILHGANALLVWWLLRKLGLRLAWLGGLIFAIHPAQVESVAWIAELKNTLSMLFFLLSAGFFLDYDARQLRRDYLLAVAFFLAAMLTKTTMAMFPVVLLLYAWWKRGRVTWSDARAAAPFFVISAVLGLVTLCVGGWFNERYHAVANAILVGGFFSRLALEGLALSYYVWISLWPVGLEPVYPQWSVQSPSPLQFLPWLILAALLFWWWTQRRGWGRHLLFGFGFFIIMLLPFGGVVPVNYMSFTWVMDHFLYIPMLGLIGLAVAGLERADAVAPLPLRSAGVAVVALAAILLAGASRGYAEKFAGPASLWSYTVARNPDAWLAHYNLAEVFVRRHQDGAAQEQFAASLRTNPDLPQAHNNLGLLLLQEGRMPEAKAHLDRALQILPEYPEAHDNLALYLIQTGHDPDAVTEAREAIRLRPDFSGAWNNLGNAYGQMGQVDEAMAAYRKAIEVDPDYAEPRSNLGLMLTHTGRNNEAVAMLESALKINPLMAGTRSNLAVALFQGGSVDEAMAQFSAALQIDPDNAEARNNLGIALIRLGRTAEAMEQFQKALRAHPDYLDAARNLQLVQAGLKAHPAGKH
jgi:tetratricopeptide (TPR) repeat protein